MMVQVVKVRAPGKFNVTRRIVQGCAQQISQLIHSSQGQGAINTAFIERLNFAPRLRGRG